MLAFFYFSYKEGRETLYNCSYSDLTYILKHIIYFCIDKLLNFLDVDDNQDNHYLTLHLI